MAAPDAKIGEAYIRRSEMRRSINFTPPSSDADETAPALNGVVAPNPKYITDEIWEELRV
jgi:hypothetical protein